MRPGVSLDIWDGEDVEAVLCVGEEKGKLRIITPEGRELRIPDSHVANEGGLAADPRSAPAALGPLLKAHEAELRARAETVDLPSLWEVLADEGGQYTLDELAELALGVRDGRARSTVLRRLVGDKLYFVRKKLQFAPRTREELGETVRRRRAADEREQERKDFVAAARAWLRGGAPAATPRSSAAAPSSAATEEAAPPEPPGVDAAAPPSAAPVAASPAPVLPRGSERHLDALRNLAVKGAESTRMKEAEALLADLEAPGRSIPYLAAFDVLVRLGALSADENLLVLRHGVRRDFAPAILEEAARVAATAPMLAPGRRDLSGLVTYAIDDAETSEVDDAFSLVETGTGTWRLGVHIADPSPYIAHEGVLDLGARDRATTYYLPQERILMLPPILAEGVASLSAGALRYALSFLVDLDARGEVLGLEVVDSVIRIERRLTYEHADTLIALGGGAPALDQPLEGFPVPEVGESERAALPPGLPGSAAATLARAARLGRQLLERRSEAGALILKGPDLDLKVRDGRIRVRKLEPWTPSWVLVSESMILVNRLAAELLAARGVPAIYRRQAAPDQKIVIGRTYDPPAAAAARKALKRTEIGLTPGPHAGLGLKAYVQVTSPLRRYQDLAVHRQLKAALRGEPPPFDAESLWRVAATTDEAEKTAREIERGSREYWLLRHLETLPADTVIEATVTRPEERRTVVELTDFVYITSVQPRSGHKPGRKLKLVVDAVNPRAARLVLREVGT